MSELDRRTSTASPTDEELIAQLQQGSEEAFERLVARYKNPLMNFIFRFTGSYDEANDILQETFLRVYYHRDSYKPIAKFSTWIYTIAGNLAKSAVRRRKPGKFFSIFSNTYDSEDTPARDLPDMRYRADQSAEQSLQNDLIQKALAQLDENQREIVLLCDVQELSYEEICEITGLKIGTVKSRLNRARTKLKELLSELRQEID